MANHDWLEQNHEALHMQATFTHNYITSQPARNRMGFGADTLQGEWLDNHFSPQYADYSAAYLNWENEPERTKGKTTALYSAEKVFKPLYRKLYTGLLKNNPLVRSEDLLRMGLPEHPSGKRVPAPVSTNYPAGWADTHMLRHVIIHFSHFLAGAETVRAKPPGQLGVEIRWVVMDALPTRLAELSNIAFATQTPYTLSFDDTQRGKMLYFCLCWINTRGKKGPYSSIINAVIP
ncbi:MAG: hypothetical protein LBU42_09960 [Prevotellaceae bacterium]|jgi:hypothetical protein|nr:hypothetical protein [Prevotellaceae bacterium]